MCVETWWQLPLLCTAHKSSLFPASSVTPPAFNLVPFEASSSTGEKRPLPWTGCHPPHTHHRGSLAPAWAGRTQRSVTPQLPHGPGGRAPTEFVQRLQVEWGKGTLPWVSVGVALRLCPFSPSWIPRSSCPPISHPHIEDSQLRPLLWAPDSCIQPYVDSNSIQMTHRHLRLHSSNQALHLLLLSLLIRSTCPSSAVSHSGNGTSILPDGEAPNLGAFPCATHSLCPTAFPSINHKAPSIRCVKYLYYPPPSFSTYWLTVKSDLDILSKSINDYNYLYVGIDRIGEKRGGRNIS